MLKKYSVGNYEAGNNLSEVRFHYLRVMRTVCLRVEKYQNLSMDLCLGNQYMVLIYREIW